MRNKKKAIFNTIFLILIFSITVYMVFKGEDLGEIIHTVRQADPVYLLISVVCVVLFILGESVIIFYMMRTLGATASSPFIPVSPRSPVTRRGLPSLSNI